MIMKRMLIAAIIFGFIVGGLELSMASSDYTSGTILTKTGDAVRASRFERDQKVRGIYKGREITASLASLKSLEVMDRDKEGFKLKVENSDGKQLILSSGTVSSKYRNTAGAVYFWVINPITNKEEKGNKRILSEIKSIIFGKDKGQLKFNPKTNQFFPSDYLYDPFTGEKLIWRDPDK